MSNARIRKKWRKKQMKINAKLVQEIFYQDDGEHFTGLPMRYGTCAPGFARLQETLDANRLHKLNKEQA